MVVHLAELRATAARVVGRRSRAEVAAICKWR